jgi:hypothetical protein
VTSFAAIKLNRETIISVLGNVADIPGGKERLIWEMIKYQYQPGVEHYYIGGNYRQLPGPPDYSRQILTRTQLDLLFTYKEPSEKKNGRPNPEVTWFPVRPREQHPDLVVELYRES